MLHPPMKWPVSKSEEKKASSYEKAPPKSSCIHQEVQGLDNRGLEAVVWSDESKFQLFGSDGRQWYWKKLNELLSTRHIRPTVKHGGGNIMVWGCFTSSGIGYLC